MDERRLHRCTVPSTSDRRTSDEGQSDLGLTVLPDFPAHVASIRGFPDTERELKLRAGDCRKLLIRRRKKQQGNSREDRSNHSPNPINSISIVITLRPIPSPSSVIVQDLRSSPELLQ